ncbi:MAG: hypothetical protein WB561_22905 [Terracidiphilus sp.]
MKAELAAWNNGDGIDLETWISCEGNFSLAVGYASIFWPAFTLFEGYILPDGVSEDDLRGFEQNGRSRKSVEWVMNPLHIAFSMVAAETSPGPSPVLNYIQLRQRSIPPRIGTQ